VPLHHLQDAGSVNSDVGFPVAEPGAVQLARVVQVVELGLTDPEDGHHLVAKQDFGKGNGGRDFLGHGAWSLLLPARSVTKWQNL
jgi:hypothetical protein